MIRKILIVEDDPGTAKLLERRLEAEGYEAFVAQDGKEAESRARDLSPDLILMDIILPEMDGAEVMQLIKQDPQTGQIPVIFVSSVVGEGDSIQSEILIGDISYPIIPKPIDFEQLLAQIKILSRD